MGDLPGNNWSSGSRTDLNRLGAWLGAKGQSNADEDSPSTGDIDTAARLGRRVALITRRFKNETPFETIRFKEPGFRHENLIRKERFPTARAETFLLLARREDS